MLYVHTHTQFSHFFALLLVAAQGAREHEGVGRKGVGG